MFLNIEDIEQFYLLTAYTSAYMNLYVCIYLHMFSLRFS